jgi:hypothetical protein
MSLGPFFGVLVIVVVSLLSLVTVPPSLSFLCSHSARPIMSWSWSCPVVVVIISGGPCPSLWWCLIASATAPWLGLSDGGGGGHPVVLVVIVNS